MGESKYQGTGKVPLQDTLVFQATCFMEIPTADACLAAAGVAENPHAKEVAATPNKEKF